MRVSILRDSMNVSVSLLIRYNDADYGILLKQQQIEIIAFVLLIGVIVILGYIAIYYIESKNQRYQSFQKQLQKGASFDYHDNRLSLVNNIDDDNNNNKNTHKSTITPGFTIKTNMNISPTECNVDDDDENIMEVCSVHSNVSVQSNMGECDIKIDDSGDHKFVIDKDNVIQVSNEYPEALIGWRVRIDGYGFGVIIDVIKRKMRSTKYKVEFDLPVCPRGSPHKKSTYELLLYRSEKKRGVPFTVVKKVV